MFLVDKHGNIVNNDAQKAEEFDKYFTSVFGKKEATIF